MHMLLDRCDSWCPIYRAHGTPIDGDGVMLSMRQHVTAHAHDDESDIMPYRR